MATTAQPKVRFHGPPGKLQALVPMVLEPSARLEIALDGKALGVERISVERVTPLERAGTLLRIALPLTVPAGSHAGRIELDKTVYEVVLTVEAHVRVILVPDRVALEASDGQTVVQPIAVANLGNLVLDVPQSA